MRTIFDPGDGSFEVILGKDEPLPPEWDKPGVTVLREVAPNHFVVAEGRS